MSDETKQAEIDELRAKLATAITLGIAYEGTQVRNVPLWAALMERGEAVMALRWVAFGEVPPEPIKSPLVRGILEKADRLPPE